MVKFLSKGCDKLSLNLSTVADIIGIVGGVVSFITFLLSRSIFKDISIQKQDYNEQRKHIQTTLMALRQNIWDDDLDNIKIRSQMREALFSYFNKYWSISSSSTKLSQIAFEYPLITVIGVFKSWEISANICCLSSSNFFLFCSLSYNFFDISLKLSQISQNSCGPSYSK